MDAFLTSTFTVALAEIGDKTQLLSLFLTARFRNKLAIIAGILVATLLNHAASAWLGTWIGQFFGSRTGQWILAGSFFLLGLWLLIPDKDDGKSHSLHRYGAFVVSAVLFFLAEIGDKTQVATVVLGAQFQSVAAVTTGTTPGMLLANVPVVYAGEALMKNIPLNITRVAAALLFFLIGISMVFR
jgi:putative Ca2+/H+ antiporter (TMEM165/GDT1 family)